MTAANRDVIDAVTAARAARDRWGLRHESKRPFDDQRLPPMDEPPLIFRRENQLRSFLFWKERGNGDGEAAQVFHA
jgi:hypothetical protein